MWNQKPSQPKGLERRNKIWHRTCLRPSATPSASNREGKFSADHFISFSRAAAHDAVTARTARAKRDILHSTLLGAWLHYADRPASSSSGFLLLQSARTSPNREAHTHDTHRERVLFCLDTSCTKNYRKTCTIWNVNHPNAALQHKLTWSPPNPMDPD